MTLLKIRDKENKKCDISWLGSTYTGILDLDVINQALNRFHDFHKVKMNDLELLKYALLGELLVIVEIAIPAISKGSNISVSEVKNIIFSENLSNINQDEYGQILLLGMNSLVTFVQGLIFNNIEVDGDCIYINSRI